MPKEVETKFKVHSKSALKKKLERKGAIFISRRLERDIYYKNPRLSGPEVIRLRETGHGGIFTIKKSTGKQRSRIYKVRQELETRIGNVKTFQKMMKELGFLPRFRKEKIREAYTLEGCRIFLDKLPFIGEYLEIEASEAKIKKLAAVLGLDIKKATSQTYMSLFDHYKKRAKRSRLELVFNKNKK